MKWLLPRRCFRGILMVLAIMLAASGTRAQVIEYESNGQKYQTMTRKGLTVIVTRLSNHVAGFGLIQVSLANGSDIYWKVQPEGFAYVRGAGTQFALSANQVIDLLLEHGSHSDVVKLVTSYERSLYGIPNMKSSNGYEQRRQNALTMGNSPKLQAAAMASAIAFAETRMAPGQSTDGAIFFPVGRDSKTLTGGRLVFRAEGETFEFKPD